MPEIRTQICLKCGWQFNYLTARVTHCGNCGEELGVTMITSEPPVGWECPVCHRGVAPHVPLCPCVPWYVSPAEGSPYGEPILRPGSDGNPVPPEGQVSSKEDTIS